jgi:hypothetical protein
VSHTEWMEERISGLEKQLVEIDKRLLREYGEKVRLKNALEDIANYSTEYRARAIANKALDRPFDPVNDDPPKPPTEGYGITYGPGSHCPQCGTDVRPTWNNETKSYDDPGCGHWWHAEGINYAVGYGAGPMGAPGLTGWQGH